ncbi:hypothetical protein V490_02130 [Pseudogymnoascus sp. VKM F-3557]|nr:hypothetical protein V490_02130 [Pseudogymnoascus sp. VKM F-3557]
MPPKMPSLVVPRSGLPLEVGTQSGASSNGLIGLTLTDTLIEELINCVQSGEAIQLSLGPDSSISYGSRTQQLNSSQDPFSYDIYQNHKSSNSNSPSNIDSAMANQAPRGPGKAASRGLWNLGTLTKSYSNIKTEKVDARGRTVKQKASEAAKTSPTLKEPSRGSDDALETLRNTMAMENAKKSASTTQLVKDSSALPPAVQKRGSAAPLKSGANSFAPKRAIAKSNIRSSLPTSPALGAIPSPSLGPTSIPASQQQAEKTKATRSPIIHRLALGPATMSELEKLKIPTASASEFKNAVEKVADEVDGKWELTRKFFRELDVWKHDYGSDSDRQTAIENAIHVYDRLRLNPSEPEWQMLLPVSERGTGKCLSRIQAKIAVGGNFAAKPKPKNSEDSSRESAGEDGEVPGNKATKPAMSAAMARTTSGSSATKSKAAKEREAQDKRLSGKSTAAKAAPKKAAPPKKTTKTTYKSSQFVSDSEEEDDYLNNASSTSKASPVKKAPLDKQNGVKSNKRKSDDMDSITAANGSVKKAKKAPSTSSSSLSSTSSSKHQISDSSQSMHDVKTLQRSLNNNRAKMNTSPQKSSPLASSPPTNASDMDDLDQSTSISPSSSTESMKRRAVDSSFDDHPKKKRPTGRNGVTEAEMKSIYNRNQFRHVPTHCIDASTKFQLLYDRYLKLYQELQADPSRLLNEHRKLMDLHDRVARMKSDIIESARDKSEDR